MDGYIFHPGLKSIYTVRSEIQKIIDLQNQSESFANELLFNPLKNKPKKNLYNQKQKVIAMPHIKLDFVIITERLSNICISMPLQSRFPKPLIHSLHVVKTR